MLLNVHSYYSLRYGTQSIDQLLENAGRNQVDAMALTDINTTMGIPEFVKKAKAAGLKPVAGVEVKNGDELLFIGIAKNNTGFKELNDYLTWHNLEKKEYTSEGWLFSQVVIIYPFGTKEPGELKDYEFTGIQPAQLNKLFTSPYKNCQDKLLIWQPVTVTDKTSWFLHKSLRAIDHNTLISKLLPGQFAHQNETMVSTEKLKSVFQNHAAIIRNTEKVMEACSIDFDFTTIKNKQTFSQSKYDDKLLLHKLAMDGLGYRYGRNNPLARERLLHELEIIDKLGFSAYFLITWDIIRYSMARGFYHVGRGSGANSIVAYCLKITDVDPIKLNLYFERFLNPKRTSPPDFDIDYSWKDRDEVQDYIFKRYGKNHTALLGATSTFKNKSIFRELGKVFGLPKEEIDLLIQDPANDYNNYEIARMINTLGAQMADFPNLRTVHAGGILISEKPITCYTALDLPPKGFPTTHWDMYIAEEMGFEKLDILSQRGIGHIREAVEIIQENTGDEVDIKKTDKLFEDEKVKNQLKNGETNGCFYIESPAMQGLLKKLKCDNYISLVAASSIIRPGVAKSGMMKEYIKRFHNPENIKYLHPVMKEQLAETYGVMVYQEDVIKVAHHFAGLDLAESDVLRRAMSGKYRSLKEFKRIEDKYYSNCKKRGYPDEITQEVWRQIESFAGYSFSKAHSASYAVESFQSLYLKAHYPLEFQVAVINNFGGFYSSWVYINEARRQGATIELPCVNNSNELTHIRGIIIYLGFTHVQNLEQTTIELLINERNCHGNYHSLIDFTERVPITKEQLIILIRLGSFRFTGKQKSQLLWEAHLHLKKPAKQHHTPGLFGSEHKKFQLPTFQHEKLEDAYDEIELLGFPLSVNNFDMLQTSFRGQIMARNLANNIGRKVKMTGNLVTIKYVRTIKREIMHFGTFLDYTGEFFDTVHFPDSLKKYPFRGNGVYLILGKVVEDFGFPSLEVEKLAKLPYKPNPKE
ncbi:DNA polymerase III, alpha subunit [Tangfeifania diversioriginum]|uniref:DNA-directed DNA polymerase n=1 Tax=Tangfeifania diversioriginum TaxID=1168035 RepID=A0A1M6LK02_9BACT|nr:DNA polymerase III subunit alpha [Tangfeifania diversioriginum]SHJ71499.1 DNA polymerase III, alpha subunit [Tangfeifania diversioriginum]